MYSLKKILAFIFLFCAYHQLFGQVPAAGDLVGIHTQTDAEINAIANPIIGTLVYNTDKKGLHQYNGTAWVLVPQTTSTIVNNNDGTFTYTDENGDSTTIASNTVTNLTQATGTGVITYTNEESTTQIANVISTDADNTISTGSDGGAYLTKKFIDVYDNNNSYAISLNTYSQIRFTTVRINKGGIFTLSNNQIQVSEAGNYEIEYGVAARTDVWSIIEVKLKINGVDLAATDTYNGGWYKKVIASRKIYHTLNANDIISVWAQRTDQNTNASNRVNTIKDGSYLLLKKLD